jgi:hypothetical protein
MFSDVSGHPIGLIFKAKQSKNIVCFLLGNSPASEVYMPTFRITLSVTSSHAGRGTCL